MQVDTFSNRQLLAAGQLPEALDHLSKTGLPSKFRNELILLSGQWEESERCFGSNLIDYEQHSRERSRLTVGLLGLLDRIEEAFFDEIACNDTLYFFESPSVLKPDKSERVYTNAFPQATTRFVYWELRLVHGVLLSQLDFDLAYEVYRPDGSLMGQGIKRRTIEAGWQNSYFTNGWGRDVPGSYPPGKYTVKVLLNGKVVAEDHFTITP